MNKTASTEKPFRPLDVLVYAVLIAVCAALFILGLTAKKSEVHGFEVIVGGETVMVYYFDDARAEIKDPLAVEKLSDSEYKITSKKGYNVLKVDARAREAAIIEADCAGGECMKMRLGGGAIICAPHGVVISSLGYVPPKIG